MQSLIDFFGKFSVTLLLTFSGLCVIIGDIFAKGWSENRQPYLYFLALTSYFASSFLYLPTLLRKGLVVTTLAWMIFAVVGFLLVGVLMYKETFTPIQIAGVILGIVALILLSLD